MTHPNNMLRENHCFYPNAISFLHIIMGSNLLRGVGHSGKNSFYHRNIKHYGWVTSQFQSAFQQMPCAEILANSQEKFWHKIMVTETLVHKNWRIRTRYYLKLIGWWRQLVVLLTVAISLDHRTVLANVSGVASFKTVKTGIREKGVYGIDKHSYVLRYWKWQNLAQIK